MKDTCQVVVLNWNGREFIRTCLRAALQQSYSSYRVIVVDNHSTDGSREIVHDEFPEVTLLPLPENRQFARGTNAGLREALSDTTCAFVATLNHDTRVDSEWLAELIHAAPERVGMVASKMMLMDRPRILNSTGVSIGPDGSGLDRGWNQVDEGQFDRSEDVFGPTAGAALYRRTMLESVGLFDEDFVAYYEDLDLAWRARLAGWHSRFAPRAIVHHKFSASHGRGSAQKTYFCERNRIWNLVQNYPWRYAAAGIPWGAIRLLAGPLPWAHPNGSSGDSDGPGLHEMATAMARARLDAYAGLERALMKRKQRKARSRVDTATVGSWLRTYRVSMREAVLS